MRFARDASRGDIPASPPGRCRLVAVALTAVVLAGCGGGDDSEPSIFAPSEDAASDAAATPDETTDEAAVDAGDDEASPSDGFFARPVAETIGDAAAGEVSQLIERVPVGQTIRYAGFDIDIVDVLIGFDPVGFAVAQINVEVSNRTPGRARLMTTFEIESVGFTAVIDRDATPDVDAEAAADGWLSLRLDPSFDLDDAVLFIGRSDNVRAQVPLGSVGELVTLTPIVYSSPGEGADDVSTVSITSAILAWDSADPRGQSAPGEAFLEITWDLTTAVGTALNDDVITLRLPSGTAVTPERATRQQVEAATTATGLSALFRIAEPASGDYVLVYTERFGNGVVEVPFSLD